MRALLYEAAQVMLFRSQKWSWLKAEASKSATAWVVSPSVVELGGSVVDLVRAFHRAVGRIGGAVVTSGFRLGLGCDIQPGPEIP